MSRIGLSCVLVLSLTSSLTSVADARRLPQAGNFAVPPPSSAVAIDTATAGAAVAPTVAPMPGEFAPPVAPSRSEVRAALIKIRQQNLAHFRSYWMAGVYPSNVHSKKTANVWRDQDDHFCAAATIMVKSGNEALAIKLAETNNFIKLGDVKQGPVLDWIVTSGFTQDELALIQRPFRPVADNVRPLPVAPANPDITIAIDARKRKAENERLMALYKKIEKQLVAKQKQSIERATDRVMKNPALAAQLVASVKA